MGSLSLSEDCLKKLLNTKRQEASRMGTSIVTAIGTSYLFSTLRSKSFDFYYLGANKYGTSNNRYNALFRVLLTLALAIFISLVLVIPLVMAQSMPILQPGGQSGGSPPPSCNIRPNMKFDPGSGKCVCTNGYFPDLRRHGCVTSQELGSQCSLVRQSVFDPASLQCRCADSSLFPSGFTNRCESKQQFADQVCDDRFLGSVYNTDQKQCVCPSGMISNADKTGCMRPIQSVGEVVCPKKFPGSIYNPEQKKCLCPLGTHKGIDGKSCEGAPAPSQESHKSGNPGNVENEDPLAEGIFTPGESKAESTASTTPSSNPSIPPSKSPTPFLSADSNQGSDSLDSLDLKMAQAAERRRLSQQKMDQQTGGTQTGNNGLSSEPRTERSFQFSWTFYVVLALLIAGGVWWWKKRAKNSSSKPRVTRAVSTVNAEKKATASQPRKESRKLRESHTLASMRDPTYAGFWIRLVAMLLDGLIIGLPASIISVVLTLFVSSFLSLVIFVAVLILVLFLEGIKGGTPGKLILGLHIVNEDGQAIGFPRALLRNIGKGLSIMILGIGFLMIGWTGKKQGLHDMVASTFVVRV